MKKSVLLLVFTLFITGCSATVNVSIEKDKVTEEYITVGNSSDYDAVKEDATFPIPLFYNTELKNPYNVTGKEEGIKYYDTNVDDANRTIINKGTFDLKDHVNSTVMKYCFEYYNISEGNTSEELTFSTSNGITCGYNNFVLNVNTPYKVTFNNADSVDEENNIYTWNVNDKNYSEKQITLMIDFSQKYDDSESNVQDNDDEIERDVSNDSSNSSDSFIVLIIVVSILFVLGVVIIVILKNRKNKVSSLED